MTERKFNPDRLQWMVVEKLKVMNVTRLASEMGVENADLCRTGLNFPRWDNPTANKLAKAADYFNVPVD